MVISKHTKKTIDRYNTVKYCSCIDQAVAVTGQRRKQASVQEGRTEAIRIRQNGTGV
jgi:hypothetical protein